MKSWRLPAALFAFALCAAPAMANDSEASLAAGGLVLEKSANIEMRSEDLFLSERLVRVRYHFANTSVAPVTALVAFPLPDLTPDPDDIEGPPVSGDSPTNFLGFKTTVDGQPVHADVELKAVKGGVDHTALLKRLGVPLSSIRPQTNAALNRLPKARQDELIRLGLVVVDPDAAAGQQLRALWTLKTTYFWRQTFPPGREVVVEHRYAPVVGSFVTTFWAGDPPTDPDVARGLAQSRRQFCIDDSFIAAARATHKPGETESRYSERYIEYVLTTGANWKAPIGDFRMTIDKGAAANLVSFCGQGVRKTGPTTFEVHYTNFTPSKDVAVLILAAPAP